MPLDLNGDKIYSASIGPEGQPIRQVVTSGMIAYIDAGDLNSYPASGTTWTDISGIGNTCSISNGSYNGANGGSIVFNGSNTYAYKGAFTSPPTTAITLETFIKFADTGNGGRYVMALGRDIGGATGGMALIAYGYASAASGQVLFEFGSSIGRVSFGFVPTVGIWYHLAVTSDGSNTRSYVNGNLQNTAAQAGGSVASSPGFSVGSYLNASIPPTPSSAWCYGNIAVVRVYNRTLSSSEILQNFYAQKSRFGL